MYKKNLLLIFLLFFFTKNNYGQEIDSRKHINHIHKTYEKELSLNKEQSKKIKQILLQYNPEIKKLINTKATRVKINKLIKLEVLEIFNILTREQFSMYKTLKKVLEENKKFRK